MEENKFIHKNLHLVNINLFPVKSERNQLIKIPEINNNTKKSIFINSLTLLVIFGVFYLIYTLALKSKNEQVLEYINSYQKNQENVSSKIIKPYNFFT